MKILYVAYSCLPNKGSEEKIGWNIPMESAKTNEVIVVTKEEHRKVIEEYVSENGIKNPKFYFVDIPKVYKRIWKGSAYSVRLNIWHKRAFPVVQEICRQECVELIHQITPIEFRSIGPYYKIPDTRFVCGPLGGGESIPAGLRGYARRNMPIELLRGMLNALYKTKFALTKQLKKCDYFMFANRETRSYMRKLTGAVPGELYFDNGVCPDEFAEMPTKTQGREDKRVFLIAGRMAYRKGHRFLLDVLRELPADANCEFRMVGSGPELERLKRRCHKYRLDSRVVFTGRISFDKMAEEFAKADAFIMPSIRETTGAVLLEAASKSVPVITIDRFGGPVLFDESSAYFYRGNSKKAYIQSLKQAILACIENPGETSEKGRNARMVAQAQLWAHKVEKYNAIYKQLLE